MLAGVRCRGRAGIAITCSQNWWWFGARSLAHGCGVLVRYWISVPGAVPHYSIARGGKVVGFNSWCGDLASGVLHALEVGGR